MDTLRILAGKLKMMEHEVDKLQGNINRLKAWITGMRNMMDRFDEEDESVKPGTLWLADEPDMATFMFTKTACCVNPPGDGSTCAGGDCCCGPDYVCDKCKGEKFGGEVV